MASLYKQDKEQKKSVIQIIRESVDVDALGSVRFKSRQGRGSGKAVEIPHDQFDEFVDLMIHYRENREALASQERAAQEEAVASADNPDEEEVQ